MWRLILQVQIVMCCFRLHSFVRSFVSFVRFFLIELMRRRWPNARARSKRRNKIMCFNEFRCSTKHLTHHLFQRSLTNINKKKMSFYLFTTAMTMITRTCSHNCCHSDHFEFTRSFFRRSIDVRSSSNKINEWISEGKSKVKKRKESNDNHHYLDGWKWIVNSKTREGQRQKERKKEQHMATLTYIAIIESFFLKDKKKHKDDRRF